MTKDNKNMCRLCDKSFESKSELKVHEKIHEISQPHVCSHCDLKFTTIAAFKNHNTSVHSNIRPYVCADCGKAFAVKERLRLHVRMHTGDNPYKCDECPKSFARNGQLVQHKRCHTGMRPFKCNLCNSKFTSSGNLKVHLKRHLGLKEFSCEVCGRQFTRRDGLQKHLSCFHGNEKPFECTICGKRYKGHLMQHLRTHLREKPHSCTICEAKFVQRSQLTVHLRTHTGEKPYECRDCGRCFAHSTALKLHMRRHTGEKPFRCPICPNTSFVQLPHLKKHMRCIHKSDKPYLCTRCGEFYKKKVELDGHLEVCRADENLPPGKCSNGTQTDPLPEFEDDDLALAMDIETEPDVDDPAAMVTHEVEKAVEPSAGNVVREENSTGVTEVEPRVSPLLLRDRSLRRNKTSPRLSARNSEQNIATTAEISTKITKSSRKTKAIDKLPLPPVNKVKKIVSGDNKIALRVRSTRVLKTRKEQNVAPPIPTRNSRNKVIHKPNEKLPKIRVTSLEKLKRNKPSTCNGINSERSNNNNNKPIVTMTADQMRAKVGALLQKISTPERLESLGFGTRAIDDVLHDSIASSGRKPCEENLSVQEKLLKNVDILLEWTIPPEFMVKFRKEQRTTEDLLEELTS